MKSIQSCLCLCLLSAIIGAQNPYITTAYLDNFASGDAPKLVKGVGDVNADGIPDYAVSKFAFAADQVTHFGDVIVYSGSDNSILHQFSTNVVNDSFGFAVAEGGDINNDGFGDILVGAPFDNGSTLREGLVIAYSGMDGSVIHSIQGLSNSVTFGFSVAGLGDINSDGFDDFVGGSPFWGSQVTSTDGHARVISGFDGSTLFIFPGTFASYAGYSVENAGDINADGTNDIIVGQPRHLLASGLSAPGRARVYSGATGNLLRSRSGLNHLAFAGSDVAGVGDIDGDGFDDFAMGANNQLNPATGFFGNIRVFSGATGSELLSINSAIQNGRLGWQLSAVGDVNGDGVPDIAAADGVNAISSANIYSGATGTRIKSFPPPPFGNKHDMKIWPVGDQNGDGIQDIGVLAYKSITDPFNQTGNKKEIRIYTSGSQPVQSYVSNSGTTPLLNLLWIPEAGHNHDVIGELRCLNATPGGLGLIIASLAPADIAVLGTDLLVAVDSINLLELATLGANATGQFRIHAISRRNPSIAGAIIHTQFYETSPIIRASNALKFVVIP